MNYPNRLRQTLTLLALSILLCLPVTSLSEPLTVRADSDYYPVSYLNGQDWKGMDIDVLNEIFARSDLEFEVVSQPFQRSMLELRRGKVDLIPNLTVNEERSQFMYWMGPIRETCTGLVVQKTDLNTPIDSIEELLQIAKDRNLKIGYLSGASYSSYFDILKKQDPSVLETLYLLPNNNQHLSMLKLGRLFGYFFDDYETINRMTSDHYAELYNGLALHSYRLEGSCAGAYIGISKQLDISILKKLFKGYDAITADGTLEKIRKKWRVSLSQ